MNHPSQSSTIIGLRLRLVASVEAAVQSSGVGVREVPLNEVNEVVSSEQAKVRDQEVNNKTNITTIEEEEVVADGDSVGETTISPSVIVTLLSIFAPTGP